MSKDVKVTEENGVTKVEVLPFKFVVEFDDDKVMISVKGNTEMVVDGDFYLGVNGEFGIMSKDNPIHIDTLNSQLHLNSRLSKVLTDLPESIEYRKQIFNQQLLQENELKDDHKSLTDRIEQLEQEIKEIKCQMQQDSQM